MGEDPVRAGAHTWVHPACPRRLKATRPILEDNKAKASAAPSPREGSAAGGDSRSTVYHHSIKLSVSWEERRRDAPLQHWLWASQVTVQVKRRRQTPPSSSSSTPAVACSSICAAIHSAWFGGGNKSGFRHQSTPPFRPHASVKLRCERFFFFFPGMNYARYAAKPAQSGVKGVRGRS